MLMFIAERNFAGCLTSFSFLSGRQVSLCDTCQPGDGAQPLLTIYSADYRDYFYTTDITLQKFNFTGVTAASECLGFCAAHRRDGASLFSRSTLPTTATISTPRTSPCQSSTSPASQRRRSASASTPRIVAMAPLSQPTPAKSAGLDVGPVRRHPGPPPA